MKFAKATKFHRKSGEGLGIEPENEMSAGGAALVSSQQVFGIVEWLMRVAGFRMDNKFSAAPTALGLASGLIPSPTGLG